jgi:steroid 5-alpha reductase family enzyme
VDSFWGSGFVIVFWTVTFLTLKPLTLRLVLLGTIVTVCGLRLSLYIFFRNKGEGEDFRYAAWRAEAGPSWWWRSFFKVFLLQGALMWIIAVPLIATQTGDTTSPLKCLGYTGAALWLVGFIFETGGDLQLARFKSNPANKGKLLTSGLWSLTRHPNYFGDAAQWWGFWLIAASAGALWTIFSPIIITFLLMRVSGVVSSKKRSKTPNPATRITLPAPVHFSRGCQKQTIPLAITTSSKSNPSVE